MAIGKRVRSRQTPRLRTVLASLMSEPSLFMDCGTDSELKIVLVANKIICLTAVDCLSPMFSLRKCNE